jgi:hypothetical protein
MELAREAAKAVAEAEAEVGRLIEGLSSDDARLSGATRRGASPVYLMVSSRQNLTRKYGELGFQQLDRDLRGLKQAVEARGGMEAALIYVDDGSSLLPYELRPVDPTNPWQIKLLIDNLDTRLNAQGREIRYLLIVGGEAIIPFHRLPNPIDDQDTHVSSDNPYASRDANYLIPERAVGRLPDGEDVGFLHSLIQTAVQGHQKSGSAKGLLRDFIAGFAADRQARKNGHSLGYSASIWRKASRAVFEAIGEDRALRISPPVTCQEFRVAEPPRFSYFNLHGIEDGADWYGQRDSLFPADYPLFPVALRPRDLSPDEHADSVIFTEACYGANIQGKGVDDSIALRFLASRALAVVGSTKVAYGSIAPPLMGADLIGKHFWEGLRSHLTVGEALQYAKVNVAREMQDRQGYLDGEDQKSLISFVLYGDPSLPGTALRNAVAAKGPCEGLCPPLICQRRSRRQKAVVSDDLVAVVKGQVENSLPHMARAQVRANPLAFCSGDCGRHCALGRGSVKARGRPTGGWAFTLEKDIPAEGGNAHRQVVKVTVDDAGHILKLAVSK